MLAPSAILAETSLNKYGIIAIDKSFFAIGGRANLSSFASHLLKISFLDMYTWWETQMFFVITFKRICKAIEICSDHDDR